MSTATVLARTGRAEWSRIWSVRSSWILALRDRGRRGRPRHRSSGTTSPTIPPRSAADATAWDGGPPTAMFALFGILALAVVTATADHGTGGIVPTLQWTPRRGVLLAARVGVIVATATAARACCSWPAPSAAVRAVRARARAARSATAPRSLGGLAFVFATGALLAVGLGLALRSTAGGLVTVIALVLVLPILLAQLPYDWAHRRSSARMPGSGALFLIFGEGPTSDMTVASSRITLAAWAVAALVAGGWRLLRSDARPVTAPSLPHTPWV